MRLLPLVLRVEAEVRGDGESCARDSASAAKTFDDGSSPTGGVPRPGARYFCGLTDEAPSRVGTGAVVAEATGSDLTGLASEDSTGVERGDD